ncbi:MAG: amidohydrolase family protein [Beijerinckiaceae bacterium]|nr:amidohydrolase family protein [Beijerinckiaceae bacterium]
MNDATRPLRRPKFALPRGACDTHLHIYGPFDRFPLATDRVYNIQRSATLEDYRSVMDQLGLERAVVVNGGGNGYNNAVTLDAIARSEGRLKGLALVRPETSDADLVALHEGGMTGFRTRTNGKGAPSLSEAAQIAPRVRDFGWHMEFHVHSTEDAVEALPHLQRMGLPYVLDHVAHLGPERPLEDAAAQRVLGALRDDDNCWVNLYSFYQRSKSGAPAYSDMISIVRALLEAAPDRLVWGTNWPHVVIEVASPHNVDLVDFLFDAIPEQNLRDAVLAANPARLYGWAAPTD